MSEGRSVKPPPKPPKPTFPAGVRPDPKPPQTGDSDVAVRRSQFVAPHTSTKHSEVESKHLQRQLRSSNPEEDQPGGQGEGAAGGHVIPSRSHQKPTSSGVPTSHSKNQGTSSEYFSRLRGRFWEFGVILRDPAKLSAELVLKQLFPERGK